MRIICKNQRLPSTIGADIFLFCAETAGTLCKARERIDDLIERDRPKDLA
jgi:hypothetical protein